MRILIVGSGGREHAIAWKLAQSRHRPELLIAPGNAGTAQLGENLPIKALDLDGMVAAAKARRVDLVFVSPDDPLAAGMVDCMQAAGVRSFGPTQAAARIESSKVWAKRLMNKAGIPTAEARYFTDTSAAADYAMSLPEGSFVIKADSLTAGKGVIVPDRATDLKQVFYQLSRQFGAGTLVEQRLTGPEVSVFAFVSGETVSAEVAACDYKRALEGDAGMNTGGMGAYSPPEFWTPELAARVRREVLVPAAAAMVQEGCLFNGVLYASLMLTPEGPKVIEFNARLGDPEAQVILPRLETDLLDVCDAVIDGRLADINVRWGGNAHVGVVMASGGYPESYQTGFPITGLTQAAHDAVIFHAGTRAGPDGEVLTNGGRVLTAVGSGADIGEARANAYAAVAKIKFQGAQYRRDIASRAVTAGTSR